MSFFATALEYEEETPSDSPPENSIRPKSTVTHGSQNPY